VTSTRDVLRGREELSFSSCVLRLVKAEERGEEGGGVVSSLEEVLGTGSGSTGAEGPFPVHQLHLS
jgi:hypothetical protein